ncbi:MAG TPA: PAS domain-containing protein [Alphaproteobacteria bacterium]|nr:PAS domain-containing protein [Alphaproteobacteria bacterium]
MNDGRIMRENERLSGQARSSFLVGGGMMGAVIREHDWTATPLGTPEQWPSFLKTATALMLGSRQPMMLIWGSEHTVLYNDAYSELAGNRHAWALGRPLAEMWPEVWDELRPLAEQAYAGESVHMDEIALTIERYGYPEETHWSFSYSPVRDEAGAVGGFLVPCSEITKYVLQQRGVGFRVELAEKLREITEPDEMIEVASALLGSTIGANEVIYAVPGPDKATVSTCWNDGAVPVREAGCCLDELGGPILESLHAGKEIVIGDVSVDSTTSQPEVLEKFCDRSIGAVLAIPLIKGGRFVAALAIYQRSPRRWSDHDLSLARIVAERTWSAVIRGQTEKALRESEARHAFLLKLSDALRPLADPLDIQATASRLLGEQLGANRVAYFEVREGHYVVQRDYTNGVASMAGRRRIGSFSWEMMRGYLTGRTATSSDVSCDESFSANGKSILARLQVGALVVVPLVKDDRFIAGLTVQSVRPRQWTASEVALAEETAERTWATLERARAEAALRESMELQRSLTKSLAVERSRLAVERSRLRAILQHLPVGVWITDPHGRIIDTNAEAERIWRGEAPAVPGTEESPGPGTEEYDGYPAWEAATGRPLSAEEYPVAQALATGKIAGPVELTIRRFDGSEGTVMVSAAPVRDDGHRLLGVVGINRDITERGRLQKALRESEARLSTILEHAPIGIGLFDEEGRWLFTNPVLAPLADDFILCRSPDAEKKWRVVDDSGQHVPLDQWPGVRALRGETALEGLDFATNESGAERWLRVFAAPILDNGLDNGAVRQGIAIIQDVTERKQAEEHQRMLMAELDHRVKNVLAVVQSVANQSLRNSGGHAPEQLIGRLAALAQAHTLLADNRWHGASLVHLVTQAISPYRGGDLGERISISGPDLQVSPKPAQTLAMAFHELATNAAKYGALSGSAGRVDIEWRLRRDEGNSLLHLVWRETGGPVIMAAPEKQGFGSMLIQRSLSYELEGKADLDYRPSGLVASFELPLARLMRAKRPLDWPSSAGGRDTAAIPHQCGDIAGKRVLVVEDQHLVADQLSEALRAADCIVLGPAPSLDQGLRLAKAERPDLAVLDVNLDGEVVWPLAEMLRARGIPFVFATGYADMIQTPETLGNAPRIAKPVNSDELLATLSALL